MAAQSIPWPTSGDVTGFSVTLNTNENVGRYGINLFIGPKTYSHGCSIEVGELGCTATADNIARTPPLQAGQQLVIIIGEEGQAEAKGEFTLSWWFTFQPSP